MKYIDAHCHLNGSYFKGNAEEAIEGAIKNGVEKIIMPSTTVNDSNIAIDFSRKYDFIYAAIGIHPTDVHREDFHFIDSINPNDVTAVGEIGIDLYRDTNPPLELQRKAFIHQLEWGYKNNKPIIIHMREAEEELYEIIKNYPNLKFVMHSYTGTWEWAQKFLELGGYISMSGIVTFKNAGHIVEVAKNVPLNRLITETDTPFLTPAPNRGKPNLPEYVVHTTNFIASIRNEEKNEVIEQIFRNSLDLFNIG